MRILLTGASGFLGSRVLSQLSGHEILCLSRNPEQIATDSKVCVVGGDLNNPTGWQSEVEQFAPQWCIHLAWEGLPDYSLSNCRANLETGVRLIEVLAKVGVQRVVVAGSCWEYGSASGAVKEDQPVSGCGIFASTKRSLQIILESTAREYNFEYRWARIFFSYGPGQRATSLITHCHSAYSKGEIPAIRFPEVVQDFVYVDDVARGLIALTQTDAASGIYNIGSGEASSVGYVVNRVASHFDIPAFFPVREADLGFWADTSKITAATGWKAQMNIDDGIKRTLSALDNN